MSEFVVCGGWCKHGVMEANRCDKCIEEWIAAGLNVVHFEGDLKEFEAKIKQLKNHKSAPQPGEK
jgi:hypothetical protein